MHLTDTYVGYTHTHTHTHTKNIFAAFFAFCLTFSDDGSTVTII